MLASLGQGDICSAMLYNSDAAPDLAARGAWACVKPCPIAAACQLRHFYRYRNLVERFFNKLKHFRAIATRYDKTQKTSRSHPACLSKNLDAL